MDFGRLLVDPIMQHAIVPKLFVLLEGMDVFPLNRFSGDSSGLHPNINFCFGSQLTEYWIGAGAVWGGKRVQKNA